ncbi:MAG: hypothetical protein R2809_14595 [Flavobacteriales bacterium]
MNFLTTTLARYMFAIPLIIFGLLHYAGAEQMQYIVPDYMPFGGLFWTYASGTSLILAGISIIIRVLDLISCLSLAGTVIAFALMVHIPNAMSEDPMMKSIGTSMALKDFMIAAGALTYAGLARKK